MIEIGIAGEYSVELAEAMGRLRGQLSSRHDGSALDREQIEEIIESPWHAIMLAADDDKIVGMAILTIVFASIDKNVYLEDFVVDETMRGQGIGTQMWQKMFEWGRAKGCRRMEFTSSKPGMEEYYGKLGAEKRATNCYRVEL
jgi:GNAT superfamily N-acetyltransferase